MKGSPMVLWTCDRCGTTESKPPSSTPSQWWTWTTTALGTAQGVVETTYEVCDRCDSAMRSFASIAGEVAEVTS